MEVRMISEIDWLASLPQSMFFNYYMNLANTVFNMLMYIT